MNMKLVINLVVLMFTMMLGIHTANAANDVPLVEPGPISLPANKAYSLVEVRKAIIAGATRHHWRVENETPGTVRIILDGRNDRAVLVMDVVYDEKNYNIKYVRSEGLRYVKGSGTVATANPNSNTVSRFGGEVQATTIHSSYSRWMKGLIAAINIELQLAKMN